MEIPLTNYLKLQQRGSHNLMLLDNSNIKKNELNCPDLIKGRETIEVIKELKREGDTWGGIVDIIASEQETKNVKVMKNECIRFDTRNDPCIYPRIYPSFKAIVSMVILDFLYMAYGFREVQRLVGNKL